MRLAAICADLKAFGNAANDLQSVPPGPGAHAIADALIGDAYVTALDARISLEELFSKSEGPSDTALLLAAEALISARVLRLDLQPRNGDLIKAIMRADFDCAIVLRYAADVAATFVGNGRAFFREWRLATRETLADAEALVHQVQRMMQVEVPASPAAPRRPLTPSAAAVYEVLLGLSPHRGLTGPELLDALSARSPAVFLDQSTLTKRTIPELKPYGVVNAPRIGYYIPAEARPATDAPPMRP